MKKIKWILFFIPILFISCKAKEAKISTTSIKKGKIVGIFRARGEVMPIKTYKITSPISGIIENVLKDEADYVKKGELLLSIDREEYLVKLQDAEKEMVRCKNMIAELEDMREIKLCEKEIEDLRISYNNIKREYETNCRLYELKAIPKEALLNTEEQLKKVKLSLELKEDELLCLKRKREDERNLLLLSEKEAKANYEWIKKQIAKTEVKSPISGIIMEKGDMLEGFPITQGGYLFTIIPLLYQVKGFIDETDIGKLNINDKGIIRFDAYPYQPCIGIIKKISPNPIIQDAKGIRNFEVYLDVKPPFKIFSKMQCSLEFRKILPSVLKVNLEDVKEGDDGKRYVYLIKKGKKIKREIITGFENEREAEVLRGLKEGDIIIKKPL